MGLHALTVTPKCIWTLETLKCMDVIMLGNLNKAFHKNKLVVRFSGTSLYLMWWTTPVVATSRAPVWRENDFIHPFKMTLGPDG